MIIAFSFPNGISKLGGSDSQVQNIGMFFSYGEKTVDRRVDNLNAVTLTFNVCQGCVKPGGLCQGVSDTPQKG